MSDTQKHNKPNVPNLRFPGFSEEWDRKTFGQCCEGFDYGMNAASKPYDGVNGYIRITDIDEVTFNFKREGIVSPDAEIDENYRVAENDILFARTGASTGKTYLYKPEDGKLYFAGFLIRAKVDSEYDSRFLFYQTQTRRYKKWVQIMSMRSGQPGINSQEFASYLLNNPELSEQKIIASLLELIDQRIVTQSKVIEKLKSLMRGMNDALMDNPCWEKVPVGEFMDFYSTNSISWEQLSYEDGLIKNLHYGLIHVGLPTIVDCKKTPLPYIQNDNIPSQYTNCKNGDVAFADASEDTAEIGKVIELDNIDDLDILCGLHTIHGRDVKNRTVIGFKGFAFNSKYFHDQVRRLAQGSKVFSINTDNIKSCFLYIPNIEEQKKFVGIMRCMQDKIEAEEQVLHIYEKQKQYLLKQMFI